MQVGAADNQFPAEPALVWINDTTGAGKAAPVLTHTG